MSISRKTTARKSVTNNRAPSPNHEASLKKVLRFAKKILRNKILLWGNLIMVIIGASMLFYIFKTLLYNAMFSVMPLLWFTSMKSTSLPSAILYGCLEPNVWVTLSLKVSSFIMNNSYTRMIWVPAYISLCLLCSYLAWRAAKRSRQRIEDSETIF